MTTQIVAHKPCSFNESLSHILAFQFSHSIIASDGQFDRCKAVAVSSPSSPTCGQGLPLEVQCPWPRVAIVDFKGTNYG